MSDADRESVETTGTEEAEVFLADPDDYHQSRRLKEIHTAREHVHKQVRTMDVPDEGDGSLYKREVQELSQAVAMYAAELLPLAYQLGMDEAGEIDLPDRHCHDHLAETASRMGMGNDGPMSRNECMAAFRLCNSILGAVKPMIEKDESNEWEV
jgi:hypothetical protein